MNFKEWANKWLICYKKGTVKISTYSETYERTVKLYLIPYFGDYKLSDITPISLREFFALQADEYHLTTIQKMKICLNGIFETAIENDICFKNPMKNVKVNSNLTSKEKRTYTAREVENILILSDMHRYGIYIRLLLELGLRCSELCGLKWSDLDFDKKTISINRACTELNGKRIIDKPKNKASKRTLPISSELCEKLIKHCQNNSDDFILMSTRRKTGLPLSPCKFTTNRYKKFFIDMGIEKILTPHECRHTCGTLLYENTHDIYAVSKFLGHTSIQITAKLYVHENPEMLRKALKIS
jgi:integrase